MKEIDNLTLKSIRELNNIWLKVSVRKVANLLNKQNSLRSIQMSFKRLEKDKLIIQKELQWWFTLDFIEDDLIKVTLNISLSEYGKLQKLKELWMINYTQF